MVYIRTSKTLCNMLYCMIQNLHTCNFRSTINVPFFSDLAGKLCAQKPNKAQANQVNITGVQYFSGVWFCLRTHQQKSRQLCFILYPLFMKISHNLRQPPFLPPPPPLIECAATDRVCLHHWQSIPPPWFGWAFKIIWTRCYPTAKRGQYDDNDVIHRFQPLHQPPRLRESICPP